ncbi:hypothetical protein GUITHDRAFT_132879 [Guillardia theta CCMP2712]|uniref:Staphylococcus aureus surface protein A n=1 Tax=Guillardia theta (strain CCMP2712) TaxID=905079 RepID=L1K0F4_GUITC|nr:hypothetical protein GUITHDRAFT_132879 [Guillardia theta CCMP2712]EKX53838.1 hypothetical protein GUITHDRAFT_132879 [Guillardia theta CCMP2712]|eukprot:XP_005840818.1 hypothetical protein GUITHDRAFT_132879 [Guillardia theta CCMP2712]
MSQTSILLLLLLLLPLPSWGQAVTCNTRYYVAINYVYAQCRTSNPGALPLGMEDSLVQYNFEIAANSLHRISMVRSDSASYVSCANLTLNTENSTSRSSGHMRPIVSDYATALTAVQAEDSARAIRSMGVGLYDVCFLKDGVWSNTGISINVQKTFQYLEVGGIRTANGTRSALPKNALHPFNLDYLRYAEIPPSEGDVLAFVMPNISCPTDLTNAGNNYTAVKFTGGNFQNQGSLITMAAGFYQICYRDAASAFIKTGTSLFIQQDVVSVTVNSITPNAGTNLTLPKSRGSTMTLSRDVPSKGFQQTVRAISGLVAQYSFEDTIQSELADTKCGQKCDSSLATQYSGKLKGDNLDFAYTKTSPIGLGTQQYLQLDGSTQYGVVDYNISAKERKMSISFFMKPNNDIWLEQTIWCSSDKALRSYNPGLVCISYRPEQGQTDNLPRYLQLEITATVNNFTLGDVAKFSYPFSQSVWYHIAIVIDMSDAVSGLANLYVDGMQVSQLFFKPNSNLLSSPLYIAPATIGAFSPSPSEIYNYYGGELDEIALFDTLLSANVVYNIFSKTNAFDFVVPISGYFSFLPITADCRAAASLPSSRIMSFAEGNDGSVLVAKDYDATLFSNPSIDHVVDLPAGSYQLCFSKDLGKPSYPASTWLPTGIFVVIQQDILGLAINGVKSVNGLRPVIPLSGSSIFETFGAEARIVGESILFTQPTSRCSEETNVQGCSAVRAGPLTSDMLPGIVKWGQLCTLNMSTVYQVCYKAPGSQTFTTTGISATFRETLVALESYSTAMGDGLRVTIPKRDDVSMTVVVSSSFLAANGLVYVSGQEFSLHLSFIPSHLLCLDSRWNSLSFQNSSSLISTGQLVLQRKNSTSGGTRFSIVGSAGNQISRLPAGSYQACLAILGSDGQSVASFSTGVGLHVQSFLSGVSGNYLHEEGTYKIYFPRVSGNLFVLVSQSLSFRLNATGEDGLFLAPDSSDCVAASFEHGGRLSSPMMKLDVNGSVNTIVIADVAPGTYQVCLAWSQRPPAGGLLFPSWTSTGLLVVVQQEFLGIQVNGLRPANGIRVALPSVPGSVLEYDVQNATLDNWIMLVNTPSPDCSSAPNTSSRVYIEQFDFHVANHFQSNSSDLDQAISKLADGLYHVCFSSDGVQVQGTGVSLRIQSLLQGFTVNGLLMYPGRDSRGVVVSPQRDGTTAVVLPQPLKISSIFLSSPDYDCGMHAESVGSFKGSTLPISSLDATVADIAVLASYPTGIYQVCILSSSSVLPLSSGLSWRIQDQIFGMWAGSQDQGDGLHARVDRWPGNTIYVRGNLPNGSLSSPFIGKILFAPSCTSPPCLLKTLNVVYQVNGTYNETLDAETWKAQFGDGGAQIGGVYQVCFIPAGSTQVYRSGVSVEVLDPVGQGIHSFIVNHILMWKQVAIPYSIPSNEVVFKLRNLLYNSSMSFVITAVNNPCELPGGVCACAANRAEEILRLGRQCITVSEVYVWCLLPTTPVTGDEQLGMVNYTILDQVFEPVVGPLRYDRQYSVCFSSSGPAGQYEELNLNLVAQSSCVKFDINGVVKETWSSNVVPRIPGLTFRYLRYPGSTSSITPAESISLISSTGDCGSVRDNPSVQTSSSTGFLFALNAQGSVDLSKILMSMGSYSYQVCWRDAQGKVSATGQLVIIEVHAYFSVQPSSFPAHLTGQVLPNVLVSLVDGRGNVLNNFDQTLVAASLLRCMSPCGQLSADDSSCSSSCSEWVNVSSLLAGQSAMLVGGVAKFSNLMVRKSSGRYAILFRWLRDSLTEQQSYDFIVVPKALRLSDWVGGKGLTVGGWASEHARECRAGLLEQEDVRCRGAAGVPALRVTMLDEDGEELTMVKESDGFRVEPSLLYAAGPSSSFAQVQHAGDVLLRAQLEVGGTFENQTVSVLADAGEAAFENASSILVRRQAGIYFQLQFGIKGTQLTLPVNTETFSILPASVSISSWTSVPSSSYRPPSYYTSVTATLDPTVELPRFTLVLLDASGEAEKEMAGRALEHARCSDCLVGWLEGPGGNLCGDAAFQQRDPTCTVYPWRTVPNKICTNAQNYPSISDFESCKAACLANPSCVAISYYQPTNQVVFTYCNLAISTCTEATSNLGGTVYYKVPSYVKPECACPSENFDNRTFYRTLKSSTVAAGTQFVPSFQVYDGMTTRASSSCPPSG